MFSKYLSDKYTDPTGSKAFHNQFLREHEATLHLFQRAVAFKLVKLFCKWNSKKLAGHLFAFPIYVSLITSPSSRQNTKIDLKYRLKPLT